MQLEATGTTHKTALGTTVVTGLMPAAATGLRGMPRVHPGHRQAAFLRFVREKRGELRKRPAMQAPFGLCLPFGTDALAYIRQVFEDQCATRGGSLDKLLRQDMITVTPKASLGMPEVAQVPLGAFGAALLQHALETEVAAFSGLPGFLAQKLVGRGHCGMCQSKINTDHLLSLGDDGRRNSDDDMQPPGAILMLDQVRGIDRKSRILGGIGWHGERQSHPSRYGRETHGLRVPGQRVGMHVVPWGTVGRMGARSREGGFLSGKCRFESFRGFHPCLNHEVSDEARAGGFHGIVRGVVQSHAVLVFLLPAVGTHLIKRGGELVRCVSQRLRLCWCGIEYKAYSSLHTISMPYVTSFCHIKEKKDREKSCPADAGRACLCRLQSAVPGP